MQLNENFYLYRIYISVVLSTHHFHHQLQPVLQSHRNISSNLCSTGGKSVVWGSSLNSEYLHPHSIASNSISPISSLNWKYTVILWHRAGAEAEADGQSYAYTAFEDFFTFSEYRS